MISGKYELSLSYTNTIHTSQRDATSAAHMFETTPGTRCLVQNVFARRSTIRGVVSRDQSWSS